MVVPLGGHDMDISFTGQNSAVFDVIGARILEAIPNGCLFGFQWLADEDEEQEEVCRR